MKISLIDHTTGDYIRSWNQSGSKDRALEIGEQYLVHPKDTIQYSKVHGVEVWLVPDDES